MCDILLNFSQEYSVEILSQLEKFKIQKLEWRVAARPLWRVEPLLLITSCQQNRDIGYSIKILCCIAFFVMSSSIVMAQEVIHNYQPLHQIHNQI